MPLLHFYIQANMYEELFVAAHLEVHILVDLASCQPWYLADGGHIDVEVREEEEIHTAAGSHTLLTQLGVEVSLRHQQCLQHPNQPTQKILKKVIQLFNDSLH